MLAPTNPEEVAQVLADYVSKEGIVKPPHATNQNIEDILEDPEDYGSDDELPVLRQDMEFNDLVMDNRDHHDYPGIFSDISHLAG